MKTISVLYQLTNDNGDVTCKVLVVDGDGSAATPKAETHYDGHGLSDGRSVAIREVARAGKRIRCL